MKNPNGYGSIFKLSGKRRKPWAVRLTVGWTDEGRQEYKYLGYYKSRPDAVLALAKYNDNPYDIDANKITFQELYVKFSEYKFPRISKHGINAYTLAFNHSEPLHDLIFRDIRKNDLQRIFDDSEKSYSIKGHIRSLVNQMYKYAMENDIVEKNYASFIEMPPKKVKRPRKPFTEEEINMMWEKVNSVEYLDTILIMIYTGLRPGELLAIKNNDIFLDERYMIGGFKTESGTNRIIPIHKKIHPLIEARMDPNKKTLVTGVEGRQLSHSNYLSNYWRKAVEKIGLKERTPHECRHTFATLMDNANANKISIKKIMGHSIVDITDGVYTHKDLEQLLKAIDLLD